MWNFLHRFPLHFRQTPMLSLYHCMLFFFPLLPSCPWYLCWFMLDISQGLRPLTRRSPLRLAPPSVCRSVAIMWSWHLTSRRLRLAFQNASLSQIASWLVKTREQTAQLGAGSRPPFFFLSFCLPWHLTGMKRVELRGKTLKHVLENEK